METRAEFHIYGHVQGVFFRYFIKNKANFLNIGGWVKNTTTGSLEGIFEGDKDLIKELLEKCREGPPGSRVGDITVNWNEYTGDFTQFDIR